MKYLAFLIVSCYVCLFCRPTPHVTFCHVLYCLYEVISLSSIKLNPGQKIHNVFWCSTKRSLIYVCEMISKSSIWPIDFDFFKTFITIQNGRSLPKLKRRTTCFKDFHCPFCSSTLSHSTKLRRSEPVSTVQGKVCKYSLVKCKWSYNVSALKAAWRLWSIPLEQWIKTSLSLICLW